MINIRNLTITYGDKTVLKDINIAFATGNIHGIVGLNGAGKTTFFNTLAGIIKAPDGAILMDGQPISRKQLGYLETENFFYSGITGREYLGIFTTDNKNFDLEAWQKLFSLPLDELVVNYSTGMKKKIALLSMMKQDKQILILDEPFNGMDMESNKTLEKVLIALQQKGKTIFISSHILESLFGCCNQLHYLQYGSFQKSYNQDEFGNVSNDVFRQMENELVTLVQKAV